MRWGWPLRAFSLAAVAGAGRCAYIAHYYRPVPDYPDGAQQPTKRRLLDLADEVFAPRNARARARMHRDADGIRHARRQFHA